MFDKNGYYNTNKLKSYEALFYIVTSERGIGKTYGEKKCLFKNYRRYGHRFACIYRTGHDLASTINTWLAPLTDPNTKYDKMPPVDPEKFKWTHFVSGGVAVDLQFEGDTIGYFRTLRNANKVKLETFPLDISEVFFDEFAPLVWTKLQGIENEGEALRMVIDTMDHDTKHRKVTLGYPPIRTVMFANPRNRTSPLYDYFQIPAFKYGVYKTNKDVVCEQIKPTVKPDDGGLGEDARTCVSNVEVDSFIEPIPKGAYPDISIRIANSYYTIYAAGDKSYVAKKKKHAVGARRYFGTLDRLLDKELCLERKTSKGTLLDRLKRNIIEGAYLYPTALEKYSYMHDVFNA